jgi:hypothetical protein
MAAPFISNDDDARRLVAAYRSGSLMPQADRGFRPAPASIIPALNLGLLDDFDAVDELFASDTLDIGLINGISDLLRSEEGRNHLAQKLHSFTGTITEDEDRDGFPESRAVYRQGSVVEYHSDSNQDGVTDIFVLIDTGLPRQAEMAALPSVSPASGTGMVKALIHWERYPSVLEVTLGRETYRFAPGAFHYASIVYEELCATETYAGLLFPRHDPLSPGLTRRMLSSFAVSVQRPSAEFEGGIEYIILERGIPVRAEVTLNNMTVSVTEFENGSPVIQRLDLDRDGRMETIRRFRRIHPAGRAADELLDYRPLMESSESDWDGDGIFEYRELYREDGSVVY